MKFTTLLQILAAIAVLAILGEIVAHELTTAAEWLDNNGGLRRIWTGDE